MSLIDESNLYPIVDTQNGPQPFRNPHYMGLTDFKSADHLTRQVIPLMLWARASSSLTVRVADPQSSFVCFICPLKMMRDIRFMKFSANNN
jgi:hypothetical protein